MIDPDLKPICREIDRRNPPVLIHPATPPGSQDMKLGRLLPTIGFTFGTSLAISRMIFDGFLDRYQNLSIIASNGGGTLPYLLGRMDLFFEKRLPLKERNIQGPPSHYLRRIYYDSVVYQPSCLSLCIEMGGSRQVLFGTDYPHPTNIPFLMEIVDNLPNNESAAIKGGNAVNLFNL